jgi:hypothetical protein
LKEQLSQELTDIAAQAESRDSVAFIERGIAVIGKYQTLTQRAMMGCFHRQGQEVDLEALKTTGNAVYEVVGVTGLFVRAQRDTRSDVVGTFPRGWVFASTETIQDGESVFIRTNDGWVGPVKDQVKVLYQASVASSQVAQAAAPVKETSKVEEGEQWACECGITTSSKRCPCGKRRLLPWTCAACTFINENLHGTHCEICGTERLVEFDLDERGECTNGHCPMRQIEACRKYFPPTSGNQTLCSFCGCAYDEHKALAPQATVVVTKHTQVSEHVIADDAAWNFTQPASAAVFEQIERFLYHHLSIGALTEHMVTYVNALTDRLATHHEQSAPRVKAKLNQLVRLVHFVDDRQHLTNRLLQSMAARILRDRSIAVHNTDSNSVQLAFEQLVGTTLGPHVGCGFTRTVMAMLNDIDWSAKLSTALAHCTARSDFTLTLVSAANWPTSVNRLGKCRLPAQMQAYLEGSLARVASRELLSFAPLSLLCQDAKRCEIVVRVTLQSEPSKPPMILIVERPVQFSIFSVIRTLETNCKFVRAEAPIHFNGNIVANIAKVVIEPICLFASSYESTN